MVAINSSSMNLQDFEYFKSNFKVKLASVSTLEEADIILIGEIHGRPDHDVKKIWLLNKLAKEEDILFLETGHQDLDQDDYYFGRSLLVRFKLKGWDSLKDRIADAHLVNRINKYIKCVESVSSFSRNESDLVLKNNIQSVEQIVLEFKKIIDEALTQAEKEKITLNNIHETKNNFNKIKKSLDDIRSDSNTPLFYLQLSYLNFLAESLDFIYECYEVADSVNFFNRNKSMAKNIEILTEKNQKVWIIAGKGHLWRIRNNSVSNNESVQYLQNALEGKKFVILGPKKDKEKEIVNVEANKVKDKSDYISWITLPILKYYHAYMKLPIAYRYFLPAMFVVADMAFDIVKDKYHLIGLFFPLVFNDLEKLIFKDKGIAQTEPEKEDQEPENVKEDQEPEDVVKEIGYLQLKAMRDNYRQASKKICTRISEYLKEYEMQKSKDSIVN